jgi:hypothetical protein
MSLTALYNAPRCSVLAVKGRAPEPSMICLRCPLAADPFLQLLPIESTDLTVPGLPRLDVSEGPEAPRQAPAAVPLSSMDFRRSWQS